MSRQTGANDPRPVPALTLTPAPKVHDHCVEKESTLYVHLLYLQGILIEFGLITPNTIMTKKYGFLS